MKKYKGKGFTLVELLAVIVILAILVLVATPAVTSIMQKSQKNALKNEVISMVRDMERAFTEKSGFTPDSGAAKISNITTDGKSYKYLCMSLSQLVSEQYIKKDLGDNYGGYIQMWVPDGSGETITFINVTNTSFYLQGRYSVITSSTHSPSQTPAGDDKVPTPNNGTGCPSSTAIPAATVTNS